MAQIIRSQREIESGEILFQIFATLGPGDGNDVVALRTDPRQSLLGRRAVFFRSDLLNATHEIEILLEILSLETRRGAAEIFGTKVFKALYLPGKKASAERTVSNKADAQLPAGGNHVGFVV